MGSDERLEQDIPGRKRNKCKSRLVGGETGIRGRNLFMKGPLLLWLVADT